MSDGRGARVAAWKTGETPVLRLGFGDSARAVGLEEVVEGAEKTCQASFKVDRALGLGRVER